METFYDAHCHLFNEKYVLRSILTASRKTLDLLLERSFDFIKTSVAQSYEDLAQQYEKAGISRERLRLIVLSYDLDYVFQEKYEDVSGKQKFYFNYNDLKLPRFGFSKKLVDKVNALLEKSYEYKFEDFLHETLEFYKGHKDQILLFYYFDPRRSGSLDYVYKYVKTKDNRGDDRPFYGVKLYPSNGYSPLDPAMLELFDYCQREQIPITVHYSYGGFSTFANRVEVRGAYFDGNRIKYVKDTEVVEFKEKGVFEGSKKILPDVVFRRMQIVRERAEKLNHPVLWSHVLGEFPDLRVDFAHYGMGSNLWTHFVLEFVKKHKNVYTDVSCTDKRSLKHFKKYITADTEHRILYGSDYVLNELGLLSTTRYVRQTRRILGRRRFYRYASRNVEEFLRLRD